MRLVAIDFETADSGADSACAVALVAVEGGRVGPVEHRLIRPPRARFAFTWLHGIAWQDVAGEPCFGEVWADLGPLVAGADYLVAHNAPFDRRVLEACCDAAGLERPATPFLCTVRLARAAWGVRPTRLPDVCRHLGIPLRHHDAGSDALACARIAAAALAEGHAPEAGLVGRRPCRARRGERQAIEEVREYRD
jgi:DNA polymerase III subunit epsilon